MGMLDVSGADNHGGHIGSPARGIGPIGSTQGLDLLSNKVLVGEEKLLPVQASMLWLDDAFANADSETGLPTEE